MDDQNTEYEEYEDYEALHDELFALLDQHRMKALSQKLNEMNEFDISEFLGELWEDNPQRMAMVFRILSKEIAASVFANLQVEEQETIINSITDTELAGIIEELYVDDAVDMMEELPANVVKRVMRTATPCYARAHQPVSEISRKLCRQHHDGRVCGSEKIHECTRGVCPHPQDRRGQGDDLCLLCHVGQTQA